MGLTDSHGRRINYLRLSVTDRCNLRCRYCMPAEGVPKLSHHDILSFEDLQRIAVQSIALGIEKIRITGGEPLVRRGVVDFLAKLATIRGVKEMVLTTNGLLLPEMAAELRRAGVQRLNVSLDSLNPETFATITRGGDLRQALDGIAAAEEAGFPPVKINMVVMRGINDGEVLDFAALTLRKPCTVRFIEYMPTRMEAGWKSLCVTGSEVLEQIASRYPLLPLDHSHAEGPARNFKIAGAAGTIGVITPISNEFCESCNRIRVTASGMAKGCLFASEGVDLKPYLRGDDDKLKEVLYQIMWKKPSQHRLLNVNSTHAPFDMSQIGG
jgi:cyclic pyranopterin phosphate synthase